jgi:uncharacterized protein YbcV (DUF1398 family)
VTGQLLDDDGGRATIREVISLVEASRREILAEIEKLEAKVDHKFNTHAAKHEAEHDTHKIEHRRDADRRAGLLRWAVTTVMTGLGVLTALYVAFQGSP